MIIDTSWAADWNPLLGGAEAEGFGVGVGREGPTPALRATPPVDGIVLRAFAQPSFGCVSAK